MISYIEDHENPAPIHECIIQEKEYMWEAKDLSIVRCQCHAQAYTVILKGEEYACPVSGQRVIIT